MSAAAASPQPAITAAPGAANPTTTTGRSGPAKELPNPQQGMADGSSGAGAAATGPGAPPTSNNTACTSPLTVTSLEAAAAAAAAGGGVPQVVSQVVPPPPPQSQPPPSSSAVESMLDKLRLDDLPAAPQQPTAPPPPPPRPAEEPKKPRLRAPPTERDRRKLFVGGLPTDVSDREFLEFFQQFGEVIDSVVIIDRMTKRSRGFGFVTFATEKYASSLLTAIPGKTGYIHINGKRCEVKASTPKADDGSYKPRHHHNHNHHGAPGMWRSNPPRREGHRGGYVPRQQPLNNSARVAAAAHMKQQAMMQQQQQQQQQPQPRGGKLFAIDNNFNGDVDGRNFDQLHQPSPPATPGLYNPYGRGPPATGPPLYQYAPGYAYGPAGYAPGMGAPYAHGASDYELPYPPAVVASAPGASGGGYVPYGAGTYDPFALPHYPGGYGGDAGVGGYVGYGGSPPPAGEGGVVGFPPYAQAGPDGGNDGTDAAEQYE